MINYVLGTNERFGAPLKKFSINFSKAKTIFCMSLHYNGDNSYLFVGGKKPIRLKQIIKRSTFQLEFCLGSTSNKFDYVEPEEVSFKENVYDFSVYYDAIDKSDLLNLHKYLILKNDIE